MNKRTPALTPLAVLALSVLLPVSLFSQDLPEISFEKFILPNGLQVILHEDHSVPIVSVNVWYHVGSKNEKPGRTGFAHLFEHLMFEGSEHVAEGLFDKWLEAAGGTNNGSTNKDRTNYWESIPSNALELALYLDSDRMANLLAAIDQKKLDTQRDVVINEHRQSVDNQPYGRAYEVLEGALFPSNHPYSWPVIGSIDDLSAASLEDVKGFFRRYYTPNNASLCIAGDIDPNNTKTLVEKYFASIPPGPLVERIEEWVPALDGQKRIGMKDNVSLPRLYMAWPAPPYYQADNAELDVIASILSSGKNSRLYKSLVYERQIAQDVRAFQNSNEIASAFYIRVTAKPGVALKELEKAIDMELTRIAKDPPEAAEVTTAVNSYEADFIRQLQAVGDFGGKADKLNQYNVYVGRPAYLTEDLARYIKITPAAVQKAVQKYLPLDKRIILSVEPAGDLQADTNKVANRNIVPSPGPSPRLIPPSFEERILFNGLKVLIVEQHELPLVQFNLVINAGWTADPTHKLGVSSLVSELLDEGTKNRPALEISQGLKALGADLATSSSFDASNVRLNTLKKHLVGSLDIFADVLVNPAFAETELDRIKKEYQARVLQEKREPETVSIKAFLRTLYGQDHPYGQPYTGTGTEASIRAIAGKDIRQFYETYFRPNNATLIVVGDVTTDEILPILEKALKNWRKQDVPLVELPKAKKVEGNHIYLIDNPGAPQSVVVTGHLGLMRNSPEYYRAEVLNTILGGKFTSRLNMNLREDKGYTYFAISQFMYLREIGPFMAMTQVDTKFTKETLVEMLKEYRGLAGSIPVSSEELGETKKYITLSYPGGFETISQVADRLGEVVTYNLPKDHFQKHVPALERVSVNDVTEAAKRYIRPDNMLFVIMGDVKKIEQGVRDLKLGEIHYLDLNGNPIKK